MTDTTATFTPHWDGDSLPAGITFWAEDDGPLDKRRLMLTIPMEDAWSIDLLPPGASAEMTNVTDLLTGEDFIVARGPCGLGCYCGAVARWVGDL
jgi:hypothetical protein